MSGRNTANWKIPMVTGKNPESNVHSLIASELNNVPMIMRNQPFIGSVSGLAHAFIRVGIPPIHDALTPVIIASCGEPLVAQRIIPNPLRKRHAFSRTVNGVCVPFLKQRTNIIAAPLPQTTGITAAGPIPAKRALVAKRQS